MVISSCRVGRAHRGLPAITSRQADRACTAERSDSGRSKAEDGGRRLFCFAMQSWETEAPRGLPRGAAIPAAKNTHRPPLQEPDRLPCDRRLEGRGRGALRQGAITATYTIDDRTLSAAL